MDEPAEAIGSSELGEVRVAKDGKSRTRLGRRTLAESPVGVVVLDILDEHCLEVAAARDEHPVKSFAPYGADHALADGVCLRGLGRGSDYPDGVGGEGGVEGSGGLGVAIADEELDLACLFGEIHRDVAGLLGHAVSDRLGGHAGDPYETRVAVDEDEDAAPAEENGVDADEVAAISPLTRAARSSAQAGARQDAR